MTDCRERLLSELNVLFQASQGMDIQTVSDKIIMTLSKYEISECSEDTTPVSNDNEELLSQFSACLNIDGKSQRTIYQYVRVCRKLSEVVKKPFGEMKTYDVRHFLAMEKERGISNTSLENTRSFLSSFFNWLVDEEIISKSPVSRITPIKCKEEVKAPFTDVEIDQLRCACTTKKERAIVELLLSSGVRVSELCAMRVKDIDLRAMTAKVTEGKGNRERITYITPLAAVHLTNYINEVSAKPDDLLFKNNKKNNLKPGGVRYLLTRLGKRAGVSSTHPHKFRRTLATSLAKRGMDIQDIQAILGHKKIETTLMYVNLDDQKVQAAYKKYII